MPATTTTNTGPTTSTTEPDSLEAAQALPTGHVAKFVLLTSHRWVTVSVPIMTHLSPCPNVRRVAALDNVESSDRQPLPYVCWYDTRRPDSGAHIFSATAYDRYATYAAQALCETLLAIPMLLTHESRANAKLGLPSFLPPFRKHFCLDLIADPKPEPAVW